MDTRWKTIFCVVAMVIGTAIAFSICWVSLLMAGQ